MKNNRRLRYVIGIMLALSMTLTTVFGAADTIKINGEVAEIPDGMGSITEKDDRTFVPLRFVSEFLKNTVWYADDTRTAGVETEEFLIFVQDGNTVLTKISKFTGETIAIEMDTSAFINNVEGRIYIPIRFLAEAIGYTVGWDEATATATLDKAK